MKLTRRAFLGIVAGFSMAFGAIGGLRVEMDRRKPRTADEFTRMFGYRVREDAELSKGYCWKIGNEILVHPETLSILLQDQRGLL